MSTRQIVKDRTRERWDAIGPSGEVMGYAYRDGPTEMYTCCVAGETFRTPERSDALLWLSLKTDTKEGRDAYFRNAEAS